MIQARLKGFTVIELLISSTCLLLILGMGSAALVSFLRAYQKFAVTSTKQRASFQTMQSFVTHLRSADQLYTNDNWETVNLIEHPIRFYVYGADGPELETWYIRENRLWQNTKAVGPAESALVKLLPNHYLEVQLDDNWSLVDWTDVAGPLQ